MEFKIDFITKEVEKLVSQFPGVAKDEMGNSIERIGYKLERDAKASAPVITGNLRRQIQFSKGIGLTGKVNAQANYSSFVHGAPFHSGSARRTTPFFTIALDKNKGFIEQEGSNLIKRILKQT